MILCTKCGKNQAQAYSRRTQEGEKTVWLCPDCYRRLYGGAEDFITSFLGNEGGVQLRACPSCGATLEEFKKTGLLGCADCYNAFREELIPTVQFIQGRLYHAGKKPDMRAEEKYDAIRALAYEQAELRERLKAATRAGDELAVRAIRARLAEINRELTGGANA